LLIGGAVTTESGNIQGLGSVVFALIHFIIVMAALPFLLYSLYRHDPIPYWFRDIVIILSVLNAIAMALTSNAVSGNKGMFFVFAVLELLPVVLLYRRRDYVLPRGYELVSETL